MASNTAGNEQTSPDQPPRRRADIWTTQGFLGALFGLLLSKLAFEWWQRSAKRANLPEHIVTVKSYDTAGNPLSAEQWIMKGTEVVKKQLLLGSALPTGDDASSYQWLLVPVGVVFVVIIALGFLGYILPSENGQAKSIQVDAVSEEKKILRDD